MANRSLKDLIAFLEWMAEKGIMAKNTVAGRKAAVGKVLGVLDPEEISDVLTINLDDAMTRFINLEGKGYTPNSLQVYKSRTVTSIADFKSYLDDPTSFKPSITKKKVSPAKAPGKKPNNDQWIASASHSTSSEAVPSRPRDDGSSSNVLPIPIRPNLVVRIFGLPFDLSESEASKIANVVKAMAMAN